MCCTVGTRIKFIHTTGINATSNSGFHMHRNLFAIYWKLMVCFWPHLCTNHKLPTNGYAMQNDTQNDGNTAIACSQFIVSSCAIIINTVTSYPQPVYCFQLSALWVSNFPLCTEGTDESYNTTLFLCLLYIHQRLSSMKEGSMWGQCMGVSTTTLQVSCLGRPE